jgi:hypothetical protein
MPERLLPVFDFRPVYARDVAWDFESTFETPATLQGPSPRTLFFMGRFVGRNEKRAAKARVS